MSAMHVIPVCDLIEHETDSDCVCDPDLTDGIWVHHSLDNREATEIKENR